MYEFLSLFLSLTHTHTHSDTVSRSGIFCTFYIAMQQIKREQQTDIYQILKTLRTQKPGIITSAVCTIKCNVLTLSLHTIGSVQDSV